MEPAEWLLALQKESPARVGGSWQPASPRSRALTGRGAARLPRPPVPGGKLPQSSLYSAPADPTAQRASDRPTSETGGAKREGFNARGSSSVLSEGRCTAVSRPRQLRLSETDLRKRIARGFRRVPGSWLLKGPR